MRKSPWLLSPSRFGSVQGTQLGSNQGRQLHSETPMQQHTLQTLHNGAALVETKTEALAMHQDQLLETVLRIDERTLKMQADVKLLHDVLVVGAHENRIHVLEDVQEQRFPRWVSITSIGIGLLGLLEAVHHFI